jgi:hypothetical protein
MSEAAAEHLQAPSLARREHQLDSFANTLSSLDSHYDLYRNDWLQDRCQKLKPELVLRPKARWKKVVLDYERPHLHVQSAPALDHLEYQRQKELLNNP